MDESIDLMLQVVMMLATMPAMIAMAAIRLIGWARQQRGMATARTNTDGKAAVSEISTASTHRTMIQGKSWGAALVPFAIGGSIVVLSIMVLIRGDPTVRYIGLAAVCVANIVLAEGLSRRMSAAGALTGGGGRGHVRIAA